VDVDILIRIWKKPEIRIENGYLNIYRKLVSSAKYGAYLD
jgi:hypothetical protein